MTHAIKPLSCHGLRRRARDRIPPRHTASCGIIFLAGLSFTFNTYHMATGQIRNHFMNLFLFGFIFLLPAAVSAQEEQPAAQDQETVEAPSVEIREDFSDDELKSFVKANEKVMAIQVASEQKMIKAIEDEGLTIDRFNAILEQQRDPSRGDETSADELNSFNNAAQMILQENEKIEKEMTTRIEEQGIDVDTYKQIMVAYQQSPEIQSRVHELLKSEN